jgi:hypothetical protein
MSGQVNSFTVTLDANGQWIGNNANFIFVISASSAVTVQLTRMLQDAGVETFSNVQAGLQVARLRRWDQGKITGAAGATVTLYYGYQNVREDATNFQQQIATIAGTVAVADLPASAMTDTADAALAAGAQTAIAANLARRRITIGVLSTSGNGVRVSQAGGANTRGIEVQPGTFVEFRNTSALVVRNADIAGTAAAATWYAEEET